MAIASRLSRIARPFFAALGLALAAAACSSAPLTGTGDELTAQACNWPSDLNDAAPGACQAARLLVECSLPGGGTAGCLSNGALTCDGADGGTCQDRCAANQYAVVCGQVGPSSVSWTPPANCGAGIFTPAGTAYYCCACQ